MRRTSRRGFTLLEVLVATTLMAIAVGTLLSALSTSMRNASRVTDSDRAAILAQRVMDELISLPQLTPGQQMERRFDRSEASLEGGWRARVEPLERLGDRTLARIVLEVYWMSGTSRRNFVLEGYRVTRPQRQGLPPL
jgi:general secretion pathway protein I